MNLSSRLFLPKLIDSAIYDMNFPHFNPLSPKCIVPMPAIKTFNLTVFIGDSDHCVIKKYCPIVLLHKTKIVRKMPSTAKIKFFQLTVLLTLIS